MNSLHQNRRHRIVAARAEALESRQLLHAGHEIGTGLLGEYFDNQDFTSLKVTRNDTRIDFWWDGGSPAAAIRVDTFSVRWTGQIETPTTENYTFTARTDDGVRLWINNQLIINSFTGASGMTDHTASVALTHGVRYDFRMDYFEGYGRAGAKLYWQSNTLAKEIVPTDYLFNGESETAPAAPSGLSAAGRSSSEIALAWSDNSNNETGFEIQRSGDGNTFTSVGTASPNATSFVDTGLAAGRSYSYRIRAINGAGESGWSNIAQGSTQTTTPTAPTALRINAGGGNFTTTAGVAFSPDSGFSGGTVSTSSFAVANTTDDVLYSTRRWGNMNFAAPAANGAYTLRLHFADPIYTAPNGRLFNVDAEGSRILSSFDIAASGGGKAALVRSFPVTIADGRLDLAFRSVKDNAIISAVELLPRSDAPSVPAAPANLTAGLSNGGINLTWQDRSDNEDVFYIFRQVNAEPYALIATLPAGGTSYRDTAIAAGNAYRYRVRAGNDAGASEASESGSVTVAGQGVPDFTQINWTAVASAPIPRAEALHGVVDGKLYVFAGFSGSAGPVTRSDVYDPATNTWRRIADMPRRLSHAGTAVDGHNIYFAGGYIGIGPGFSQQFGTTEVWRYNTDSDAYTRIPDLPAARGSGALVLLGRELHFFGGNNSNRQDVGTHYVLNLDGGTSWRTAASIPTPRSHLGAVAYDGKIYAIGGQQGNDEALTPQNATQVYDPATDSWTNLASMPRAINHVSSATAVFGDRIITFGGQLNHGNSISDVWAYDVPTNTWTQLTSLPGKRFSGVAAIINGVIYFTGGSGLTTTWRGTPVI